MNYKKESLKIEPNLRASKVSGCAFYHIITGHRGAYRAYSEYKDTVSQAWKDCYFKLIKKQEK